MTSDDALPRVLRLPWREPPPARRSRGLTRDRIVAAAIDIADADGLAGLSMARVAERLGCGTMSLYRHVASKDELLVFMLSSAPAPPPAPDGDWRAALTAWADGLWDVYHRHPWVLSAASSGPPGDPGQLRWLEAGLAALHDTGLTERDKLSAVISLLHYVRGAAALAIESADAAGPVEPSRYAEVLTQLLDRQHYPAITAALDAGAFDVVADGDPRADFHAGVQRILDGVEVLMSTPASRTPRRSAAASRRRARR